MMKFLVIFLVGLFSTFSFLVGGFFIHRGFILSMPEVSVLGLVFIINSFLLLGNRYV